MPLDPQVKFVLDQLEQLGGPHLWEMTPVEARVAFEQLRQRGGASVPVGGVEDITIPGPKTPLQARVYEPSGSGPHPVMVFFHGGGWVIGDIETHDPLCRALHAATGSMIISVAYRLAPEHRFPAAVDDSYAAVEWVAANAEALGADPEHLGVGGDSAGGNLSAVVGLLARDRGGPAVAYQLLLYPATDMGMKFPSVVENGEGYFLTYKDMVWFMDHYIRDASDKLSPLASPLRATDHSRLPPAIVVTAEYDPLRDEGEAYAQALRKAGVKVKLRRYDGMIHGFLSMYDLVDRSRAAIDAVGADVRELTGAGAARVG
ncbi:MAG TPA: alpha/beta hydrolase [Candidatus Dormibacteraeota bacterium]|jgi:acetyl esterase|nr:alpha/beta hydrolase [Candidatus Dormibacteraeota bacterium]